RSGVQRLIPDAKQVVRVRALAEVDEEGNRFSPKGLEELIDISMDLVPEGHKSAFAAAQRVSVKQKQTRAQQVIGSAVVAAGVAGAAPIPFADAALLVPIQIGMLAGVTAVFGLPVNTAFLTTLLSAASGTLATTMTGRAIAGALLKLVPGGGTLAGSAIGASTAASITGILGAAYLTTLSRFFVDDPDAVPDADDVARRFTDELTKPR
ncbi:MAG TPA: GTP-binding protein, partial [Myxococcota bacterium]